MAVFRGFIKPTSNFSKLPHQLIDLLPCIETVGELKVILYVLRHTWGYQDDSKRITVDEFMHGRKRRDGRRLDGGTGLSEHTVSDGVKRAMNHGFLSVHVDDRDRARIRKSYSLCVQNDAEEVSGTEGTKTCPSDLEELTPGELVFASRSEKETQEPNQKEQTLDSGTDVPLAKDGEQKGDIGVVEISTSLKADDSSGSKNTSRVKRRYPKQRTFLSSTTEQVLALATQTSPIGQAYYRSDGDIKEEAMLYRYEQHYGAELVLRMAQEAAQGGVTGRGIIVVTINRLGTYVSPDFATKRQPQKKVRNLDDSGYDY
jgi:hypothetical protein